MKTKFRNNFFKITALASTLLLSGCLATTDGIKKDANNIISIISKSKSEFVKNEVQSSKIKEYRDFMNSESKLIEKIILVQKTGKLKWWYEDKTIGVTNVETKKLIAVPVVTAFRLELPNSAIANKDQAVLDLVTEISEYTSKRNSKEQSEIIVYAANDDDMKWIEKIIKDSDKTLKIKSKIDRLSKSSIGWKTLTPTDKEI